VIVAAGTLAFYARPGPFTDLSSIDSQLGAPPEDVAALRDMVQGLLVHRAWLKAYGLEPAPERLPDEGMHAASAMLRRVLAIDPAPFTHARPPERRAYANCRHFATLLTALLRRRGVPARSRCGFGAYFTPGKYEDHWVCEYWHRDERRWVLVDAQLDAVQAGVLKIAFDPLDVPREAFWVAGQAWQRARAGMIDPRLCGIGEWWGLNYVRSNLNLDVAALNKIELLPWDVYGIALKGADDFPDGDLALLDRLAELSARATDADLEAIRAEQSSNPSLRIPDDLWARIAAADAGQASAQNPIA
jgi:hypothetical protein